jgi:hypothetical protein
MQNYTEHQRNKKNQRQYVKYQWPCGTDIQEITAQIKNNFVVSNANGRG